VIRGDQTHRELMANQELALVGQATSRSRRQRRAQDQRQETTGEDAPTSSQIQPRTQRPQAERILALPARRSLARRQTVRARSSAGGVAPGSPSPRRRRNLA
jgi:hypothetical protein